MNKRFFCTILSAFVLAAGMACVPPAHAQTLNAGDDNGVDFSPTRPSFASRLNHLDGVLKGKQTVRVVAFAPNSARARFPLLGRNNKVAQLRLDNEPLEEPFTVMPHEFSWDTAQFADGTHVLSIMLLDTETRDTETLDKVIVTLNNGRPAVVSSPSPITNEPAPPPNYFPPPRSRRDAAPLPPPAATRGKAQIVSFDAQESTSERPLSATASALCQANGTLYLGLKSGGIAACNPQTLSGWVVRPAAFPGITGASDSVKSLCADKTRIYWTTGAKNADGSTSVFCWDTKSHKATAFILDTPAPTTTALSLRNHSIILTDRSRRSDRLTRILDTQTGTIETERRTNDNDADPAPDMSPEAQTQRAYFAPRYLPEQIALVACADSRDTSRWRQIGPDIVAELDARGSGVSAYLPWNGAAKDGPIVASLSDDSGVWLATTKGGVRHITPDKPSPDTGYDGYMRVRLTDGPDIPNGNGSEAGRCTQMAALVEEWQGTPYLWGGTTKKGCDCSGFISQVYHAMGNDIPRSSDEMRASKRGGRVFDELRYGDVLVFPGHVALYIGNGKTAETVGGTGVGSVSKATIWRRREVAVRRYFP